MIGVKILYPRYLAMFHRWRAEEGRSGQIARDFVIALLTFGIALLTYKGMIWVLQQTQEQLDFAYLHPSLILGLILVFLFGMLLITNTVSALGCFYFSSDLELVLASPMSRFRLFMEKLLEVIVTSSWMTLVFLLPIMFAFGRFYGGGFRYSLISFLAYIPYFVIPASVAFIFATVAAVLIPRARKGELVMIGVAVVIWLGVKLGQLLAVEAGGGDSIDVVRVLKMVSFLSVTNVNWLPSFWSSSLIGESLVPTGRQMGLQVTQLISAMGMSLSSAYIVFCLFHFRAYSKVGTRRAETQFRSQVSQERWDTLLKFLPRPIRAIVLKEFRSSSRDVTQVMQLFLLLGLCAMYVYMLSLQDMFQQAVPIEKRRWWRVFLVSTNVCIEAFVITAMGTRLVFPSISREGRGYWILATSPVRLKDLVRTKFLFWLIPVTLLTSVVFGLAAYALHGTLLIVAGKIVLNIFVCIALVALATGLGGYFANFTWEHPSQLIASFGSLVYMVISVFVILTNLAIAGSIAWIVSGNTQELLGSPDKLALVALAAIALMALDIWICVFSLSLGTKALERLRSRGT